MPEPVTDALQPCHACGSPCRELPFGNEHVDPIVLWLCSNHRRLGGDCPHDLAYFSADAWNLAMHALHFPTDEDAELIELLELAGDYAADLFNEFRDKTSPCAKRVEENLGRFNQMRDAIANRLSREQASPPLQSGRG